MIASRAASVATPPGVDRCTICLESMTSKRVVSLRPCGHSLHRTCALEWMETRCCTDAQQCPLCRAGIVVLTDAHGKRLMPVRAFGDGGQPTKRRVLTEAVHKTTLAYIQERIWEVECWISEVQSDQGAALIERAGATQPRPAWHDTYVEDTAAELTKLTRRVAIYQEMRNVYAAGGMRATATELAEMAPGHPWCLQVEMELLRAREDERRREQEDRDRWRGWMAHPVLPPPAPPVIVAAPAAAPRPAMNAAPMRPSVAETSEERRRRLSRLGLPPPTRQQQAARARVARPSSTATAAAAAGAAAAARPTGRTTATSARAGIVTARDARASARAARLSGGAGRPAWRN